MAVSPSRCFAVNFYVFLIAGLLWGYLLTTHSFLYGLLIAADYRLLEMTHLPYSYPDHSNRFKLIITATLDFPFLLGPTAPPNDSVFIVATM
jgi:hypothetical protein